ncbi:MAG: pyrroline-5-carboxylate reductase [Firmicutes bacterium]|nr:pyrroline-5-carboxylate reductase [Bacillota bacterium]
MKGLGIIGVGAMGGALARRLAESRVVPSDAIILADKRKEHVEHLAGELGLRWAEVPVVAANTDTIIVAVKPQQVPEVIQGLSDDLTPEHLLISIAAGVSLADLAGWTGENQSLIRVMPNTPCLIGRGAVVMSPNSCVKQAQLDLALKLFAVTGKVWVLPEEQMDAVTGVSGSGPAYVYLFLEAMIDGGVTAGLSHAMATELAVQTMIGAVELVAETGKHPAMLRNMVTSPAGTTAAGLRRLENSRVRGAIIEAVLAASTRSQELQRQK